jgi:hypothetical protein
MELGADVVVWISYCTPNKSVFEMTLIISFFSYSAQIFVVFEPNKENNRLMAYNWQQNDWTIFDYDKDKTLIIPLFFVRF